MGKVGGLRPPREFADALARFDPDLTAEWNYDAQSWWICQRVKRCRPVGETGGIHLSSIDDVKVPVMQLSSYPGVLDSRVLAMLEKERAVTLKQYERILLGRQREQKKAGKVKADQHMEVCSEQAENHWYDPTFRNRVGLSPRLTGWKPNDDASKPENQSIAAA